MKQLPVFYSCERCPAYCCTYSRIVVEPEDVARIAKRFDITMEEASRRFTRKGEEEGERVLRHRSDEIFQTACTFLDRKTRRCGIYEHRPAICRDFPGTRRCGYYDFLSSERRLQEDPDLVISSWIADV